MAVTGNSGSRNDVSFKKDEDIEKRLIAAKEDRNVLDIFPRE